MGQVYNDPRIPIIKRYANYWAIREVARTFTSGRRKYSYRCGTAIPPSRYAYNRANSAKRNPKAPRGRWNSVTKSVQPEGKATRHVRRPFQDPGIVSHTDVHDVDTRNIDTPTPGPSQTVVDYSANTFGLTPGPSHVDVRGNGVRDVGAHSLDTPTPGSSRTAVDYSANMFGPTPGLSHIDTHGTDVRDIRARNLDTPTPGPSRMVVDYSANTLGPTPSSSQTVVNHPANSFGPSLGMQKLVVGLCC